jgi:hypothetical protein
VSQADERPTLDEVLGQLLSEADDTTVSDSEYLRQGRAFAARTEPSTVELRLGRDIADAARRTPGTGPSARGDEWVSFSPRAWDEHAIDRLRAWFRVAWRASAGGR